MVSQLVLQDISKEYEGIVKVNALKSINLTVKAGDFISISGHSGIGKSTLLHLMGGLIEPTSGEILYNNKGLKNFKGGELDAFRANVMSFVFQEYSFVQALNLRDNLMLVANGNKKQNRLELERKIDYYLKRLDLYERKFFLPNQLSGGQKRRAMLIAGVIKESEFILADEPANDLDMKMSEEIMKILLEEKEAGRGVVLVTHNESIASYADQQYSLIDGQLIVKPKE